MYKSLSALLVFALMSCAQDMGTTEENSTLDLGIQNDEGRWIPARISFQDLEGVRYLEVINAEDTIRLAPTRNSGDTTYYHFIDYNSEMAFTPDQLDTYTGYWVNFESTPVKKRPIKAAPADTRHKQKTPAADLTGQWKTVVSLPDRSYEAILMLEQNGPELYGTMRTRSGDYQFLEGRMDGSQYYLSSFSGGSVFYLEGEYSADTLTGRIHGLASGVRTVEAVKDEEFRLPDPNSLTKIVNDQPFNLDLKDEHGVSHNFSSLTEDKAAFVSLFGTWCPNCVDEVEYLQELQIDFPELVILCVAFETTGDEAEQQKRVRGFKERKNIDIPFLIGGKLEEENIRDKFPMIDNVGIFPTSFLLDLDGNIISVHTGFNGPATGILYDQYKKETESLIRDLVRDR